MCWMNNPFSAYFRDVEDDTTFLIQDPFGIRESVQPVLSLPEDVNQKHMTGIGTCFRVSPWGFVSAFHNFDHPNGRDFPDGEVGCVAFSFGYVMGRVGFQTSDHMGAIRTLLRPRATIVAPPGVIVPEDFYVPDVPVDVAALRVDMSTLKREPPLKLLKLAKTSSKIGDIVMGVGFPIQGASTLNEDAHPLYKEELHGAIGRVTDLLPNGLERRRPWASFQIEGNWKSGMSGGPVLNTDGEVVGVISSSLPPSEDGPGIGFAVDLAKYDMRFLLPELLPASPEWFRAIGHFNNGKLQGYGLPEQFRPETFGPPEALHLIDVRLGSSDYLVVKEHAFAAE